MSGTVSIEDEEEPIAGARVELIDGPDEGKTARAGDDGRYALSELQQGTHELRASADGFQPQTRSITLTGDAILDFALRRPPAPEPPPPATRVFSGRLVEGISAGAVGGATIEVEGLGAVTTEPNGTFRIEAPDAENVRLVTIDSNVIVQRTTHLRIPGPEAELTAIPETFDLTAFDEMFRAGGGRLQRWVSAPRVSVQRTVLAFTDVDASSYAATAERMADGEIDLLVEDLAWGLGQLTDGRLAFASERRESAEEGTSVPVMRPGEIVVARFKGLQEATRFWGYGRWASDDTGQIQAGIIMLDAAFDSSDNRFRRSLRVHELGHALGYNHVTVRESAMNSSAQIEPNEFDRHGARIAFLRPPGNRSPDLDPDEFTSNLGTGALIWYGAR